MAWEPFELAASGYAEWYTTRRGRRVDQAECDLLTWLLESFPSATSALEIGCGTGQFSHRLRDRLGQVVGLDRSPAMLWELRRRSPATPAILADAHRLPFGDATVDLVVYVTALEFLEYPAQTLREAVRVARQGLLLVVLNRWSLGGLSRRWGPQAHQPVLGQARDCSLIDLQATVKGGAGQRLREMRWRSTLFPNGAWRLRLPIPLGDVVGLAALISLPPEGEVVNDC